MGYQPSVLWTANVTEQLYFYNEMAICFTNLHMCHNWVTSFAIVLLARSTEQGRASNKQNIRRSNWTTNFHEQTFKKEYLKFIKVSLGVLNLLYCHKHFTSVKIGNQLSQWITTFRLVVKVLAEKMIICDHSMKFLAYLAAAQWWHLKVSLCPITLIYDFYQLYIL